MCGEYMAWLGRGRSMEKCMGDGSVEVCEHAGRCWVQQVRQVVLSGAMVWPEATRAVT